jgi:hypothetical protein
MLPRPLLRLFGLLLLTALTLPAGESPVLLRPRWEPGAAYVLETLTETVTDLSALGRKPEQGMKIKQTTRLGVGRLHDGRKEVSVIFSALSGEAILDGKRQTFDSERLDEATPEFRASLGRSLGQQFVLVYDADDRFLEARDTSDMVAARPDRQPSLQGVAEAGQIAELFQRSLVMGLPEQAVRAGDTWTTRESLKFPSAGEVAVELQASYEATVDYQGTPHAKVRFSGDLLTRDSSERALSLGAGSKVFGQVLFDLGRGQVAFGAFRADLKLEIQGKVVPVRQQVTTRLTRLP